MDLVWPTPCFLEQKLETKKIRAFHPKLTGLLTCKLYVILSQGPTYEGSISMCP